MDDMAFNTRADRLKDMLDWWQKNLAAEEVEDIRVSNHAAALFQEKFAGANDSPELVCSITTSFFAHQAFFLWKDRPLDRRIKHIFRESVRVVISELRSELLEELRNV